ncbi:hypothetical protein [Azospirillum thermophilum]|nr:hypothetical protein [Azospirillum thermophilum]
MASAPMGASVLDLANRFEAIAADGFEGKPYDAALADLVRRIKADPALAAQVAHAVGIMIGMIEDSDPSGRFAYKTAILREAVAQLRA